MFEFTSAPLGEDNPIIPAGIRDIRRLHGSYRAIRKTQGYRLRASQAWWIAKIAAQAPTHSQAVTMAVQLAALPSSPGIRV